MVPRELPSSTLPESDLLRAARLVLAQLDAAGALHSDDEPALALRCAVQARDLAIVTRERDALHAECERLAGAVARQRADIERYQEELRLARRARATEHADGLLRFPATYAAEREEAHP